MEEQDLLEELAEEEFVKEDINAGLALYLACGGLFVLVAVFIVSACIFIRYTIRQVKLCLFEKNSSHSKIIVLGVKARQIYRTMILRVHLRKGLRRKMRVWST